MRGVRRKLSQDLGFLVPAVHIRDNLDLAPNVYRINLGGVPVGESIVYPERELAINPGRVFGPIQGVATRDPAFGMEAVWIDPSARDHAQTLGYTVVDPSTVIATHLSYIVQSHAHEILGHEEVQQLLNTLAKSAPKLIEDLVPRVLPLSVIVRVLQGLLAERIPIRNVRTIIETLAEHAPRSQDPAVLLSHVRVALGRQITQDIAGLASELPVITLEPELERLLQSSVANNAANPGLEPGLAERLQQNVAEAVRRQEATGEAAVLLVPPQLRTTLARFMRSSVPSLHVLAWNEMTRRAPIHTETLRELSEIGIAHDLASHITEQLPQDADLTYARRFAIAALSQYLNVTGDLWLENGARIAFIGATGVGKTTTLAKLAVRWVLRHGPRDLALVAADGTRLGAQDQMQSLGQLLGVPVYTPEHFETLPALLERLQQRFILIDTPGSSMRDTQLGARLSVLANSASQLQTALVLSASTQAGALEEAVKRFAPANPCCCVLTKLDEAASLGGALSVLIRARIPISYVSEGQRIPEDLRPARALELVSNAVRLAKASGAAADEDLLRRRFGKVAHAIT